MDRSVYPPSVTYLHYQFDGWLGDAIFETFPVFIVLRDVAAEMLNSHITGATFDKVEISASQQFHELYPERMLPEFVWLKPDGAKGRDDIAAAPDGRLVVSQKALDILRIYGIHNSHLEEFEIRFI